ncbi:MAG: hypothetical protein Q607_CBUC00182G0102 [Clostridium butyricum DORA_1]|jgi:hypothetical protein|uniref:hypothetical protein n=1 Tax=Clostridium butyricum TaxID=1492 RepID=UPI0003D5CFDA|nr:hypothetical protein [Clostridium butyricum]ETI89122.1 MAG: hypothetical protein Q607_CBUC00182G0102 [Clostridium butyricum DORA_1]MDU1506664.1 hypothetical protein [Clostridium butyricum]RQN12298.1 hypothetical protein EHW71_03515 [Clostridium butyricum]
MGLITRSELKYDYSWTVLNGDNPKITGVPDSTLLNRNEGYEVLWFINKFAEIYNLKNKESAFKIERMIRYYLPENIRSQENVVEWIENNWKKYE